MKTLFVGNISFQTTASDPSSLFQPVEENARVQIITGPVTGRSRGFAFVELAADEDAVKAMAGLNGREMDGRALHVNEATPKPDGSPAR